MPKLGYVDALALVDRVIEEAASMGLRISVAIVDEARELLVFVRMEGAVLASIEIAQNKAYTSRSLNRDTRDVAPETVPGGPLYGLHTTHARPMVTFGGGQLLRRDGEVIGAIGVAGGTPEEADVILDAVLPGWAPSAT